MAGTRGTASALRPHRCHHLPVQQSLLPGGEGLQLDATPQCQLDEDAAAQARGDAVIPEGGVALRGQGHV